MVDVVFLLIIFFMVSTTFITLESGLPVELPDSQTTVTEPSNLPTVTINKDGAIFFGGAQVQEAQLALLLRQDLDATGQTTVVLRADRDVPHGTARSEEHTSELQSRPHLVCRLLLEKKKHKT